MDLLRRQGVYDLMKLVQVTHDSLHWQPCTTSSLYRRYAEDGLRNLNGPHGGSMVPESIALIGVRAPGIRTSLQSLQRSQASSGLNPRGDMQAAANLMNTYLDGAEAALNAGDLGRKSGGE